MFEIVGHLIDVIFLLDHPVGAAVNWLIIILFMVGVCSVIAALVTLVRETRTISHAQAALKAPNTKCPTESAKATLEFLQVSPTSFVGQHVTRLIVLRSAGLPLKDALQQITMESVENCGALARYLATILTLLGLFGTVFGLSLAVAATQGALISGYDVTALRELARALAEVLGGMKTAFATTLAGLLTALLLSVGNYTVHRKQSRVSLQLEAFLIETLLPSVASTDFKVDQATQFLADAINEAATNNNTIASAAGLYSETAQLIASAISSILVSQVNSTRPVAVIVDFGKWGCCIGLHIPSIGVGKDHDLIPAYIVFPEKGNLLHFLRQQGM